MASFTLNSSRLGTVTLGTASTEEFVGDFREIELHFSQGTAGVDMLVRFIELHLTLGPASMEDIS